MDLSGRTALVTGGSRGIGRAACLAFANAGADVIVHYRKERQAAEEVAAESAAFGVRSIATQADVADPAGVAQMMETVREFIGERPLDILLNNAAMFPPTPLDTLDDSEWDRIIAVNVRGPFLCVKSALPLLKASPQGRIINMSSNMIWRAPQNMLAYITSKAAIIGFTHALARELGAFGVTVNCVIPSVVRTETVDRYFSESIPTVVGAQAIPREQAPEDVVGLLLFLASATSDFVTGQTLRVDGGAVLI